MLELFCVFLSWFLVFRVGICVMFLSCLVKIVVEGGEGRGGLLSLGSVLGC